MKIISSIALLGVVAGCSADPASPTGSSSGNADPDAATSADGSTPDPGDASSNGDAGADSATPPKPTTYASHLVGFDDLKSGTSITDQYKQWFTVSSIPGCALQTSDNYDFGQSKPNYLTTYFSCDAGETADVTFTFARPVRKITFKGVGINGTKGVALMKITHADGTTSEASLDGTGASLTAIPLSVPDTTPITKLLITNIQDAYGIGLDDLAFEFPE
jgi:hypothetical protein